MSGFHRAFWCRKGKNVRSPLAASRDQIHHWFRLCCDSFFIWIFLRSFRHHFRTIDRTDMANVKQTQKMIPLVTCEISLGQHVCELVFGVNVFDLDLVVQIDSIDQPIKSNSVGSGNMSHCGTSSLCDHLDHCFVVFKHIQQSFLMRRVDVWVNKINIIEIIDHSLRLLAFVNSVRWRTNFTFVRVSPFFMTLIRISNATIRSLKSSAGIPSNLNPASKEMISDSVELCETEVLFLKHPQLIGTNVWLPKMNKVPPEVDLESSRSPAKSKSWNSPNLHCLAMFPTWQNCM